MPPAHIDTPPKVPARAEQAAPAATVGKDIDEPAAAAPMTRAFESTGVPDLLEPRHSGQTGGAPQKTTAAAHRPAVTPATSAGDDIETADSGGDSGDGKVAAISATPGAPAVIDPDRLARLDRGIDWGSCVALTSSRQVREMSPVPHRVDAPIDVSADAMVAGVDTQQARFSGNVELNQDTLQMHADQLVLDRREGTVDASGSFVLSRPDIRLAGDSAQFQLNSGQGRVSQASYRIPAIHAQGTARQAEFLGAGLSRFQDINYSTCRPGDPDWVLNAESLELDRSEGFGTARHTSLRFLGVPILYAPSFTFPIDDRRRSGVLIPSVGYSSNTGLDLSVPHYMNLAPAYDLTLVPRLMSDRGLMLGGEFRFLTETTEGSLSAEYLPNDREFKGSSDDRGSVAWRSHTRFNARTTADIALNYVTDDDYFEDLGDSLAATSAAHLERVGELNYHGDWWNLLGRVQGFQTIDDTLAPDERPYSRLPQLRIDLERPNGIGGTTYHLDAEYVYFDRDDSVRGHRLDLFPALSLPLGNSWWFVEPKAGARYVAYQLSDQDPGLDDSPSHVTGLFSIDSGLYFDRSLEWFGNDVTNTLEPRLYYLLVPNSDQSEQPVFDTALLDFTFDNLFRDNRYSGPDRFGDTNQLTLALTTRLISDQSGAELLRGSIGQILYFEDQDVTLPGETGNEEDTSALVAEIAAQLGAGWQTRAGIQWDPHDGKDGTIDQALAQVSYRDKNRRVFNAAYRLRDRVTEQTDLAAIWPINDQLSVIARHNFSLRDDRLLEGLLGVEYGRCCWRVRALIRKYTDSTGDDHNLSFMLQLELNGLGRLGNDIDSTLERGIYGYRTDDDE